MKKTVLLVVFLFFLLALFFSLGASSFVPHPLGDYQVRCYRQEESIRENYSVLINSKDERHPLKDYSYATLYSRELASAWALRQAHLKGLGNNEREDQIKEELLYLDDHIVFQLYLRSQEKDAYTLTQLVNYNPQMKTFEPQVIKILLELDDGRIVEAIERHPGGVSVRGGSWKVFNSVIFPAYDKEGRPYFLPETKWAFLWLVTQDFRVYFPFIFSP